MDSPSTRSITKRACDACKRRKVKCDAATPVCAYCRISGLECTYKVVARKRGPKPGRDRTQTSESPSSSVRQHELAQSHEIETPTPHSSSSIAGPSPSYASATTWPANTRQDPQVMVGSEAVELRRRLLHDVGFHHHGNLHDYAQDLIALMIKFAFGGFPTFHEQSLRGSATWILEQSHSDTASGDFASWCTVVTTGEKASQIAAMRDFTLLMAVCGMASSLYTESTEHPVQNLSAIFHHSSKSMLRLYEDYDTENPHSSSMVIRSIHSVIHQQNTGQTHTATFLNGQARLLAQNMRLHDESVLEGYDPVEAQLLRHCFWQLLTSDRSAASLLSRSFSMHESLFDCPISVRRTGEVPIRLLDPDNPNHQPPYEERLLHTYWLGHKMRSFAADLTFGLRNYRRQFSDIQEIESGPIRAIMEHERDRLASLYVRFTCILDQTPEWIIKPEDADIIDENVAKYQAESFMVQRTHWFLTFHCLSLTILHQCMEHGLMSVLGLNDNPLSFSLKQTDVARDFVITLEQTPFRILRFSGEVLVEQIRHVGSILLRISESSTDETITQRAGTYLTRLINVLSRLDSKASDVMANRHEKATALRAHED